MGRLTAERERLEAEFNTAIEKAAEPVRAKQEEFINARAKVGDHIGVWFTDAADHAQYVTLIEEENAAIADARGPFFGPNGSFHGCIASWRTEVTEKNITGGGGADSMILQMEAIGVADEGYRSTTPLEQVRNHVRTIGEVYNKRPWKAHPTISLRQ